MLEPDIKSKNLAAIHWSESDIYTSYQQNYTKISEWWNYLAKKTVIWDVFNGFESKPVLRDILVIEDTLVDGLTLCWRKQGFNHWNTLKPQNIVLDYLNEELNIIPVNQHWFFYNYRITILY